MKTIRVLLFSTFVVLFPSVKILAQQNLFYSHYFLNPYLYNPSYIASNGYSELFLNYRNQWNSIKGAPKTVTLNLGIPINHKSGFGFIAYQDEAGILKTTTALLSYNYRIYLGKNYAVINQLTFGLSAGITISGLDASKADVQTDPVLTNQTSSLDGQVGVNYQFKNLKIAFGVPRIFQAYVASENGFNKPGIEQIKSTISSVSYRFPLSQRISIEPYFVYRTYKTTPAQYEAIAILRIDKIGWIGGSYRQDYGAAGLLGFNIKDKIKLGYAYEFATAQVSGLGNGTHELQLSIRIGKKTVSRPQPKEEVQQVIPAEQPVEEKKDTIEVEKEAIQPVEKTEVLPVVPPKPIQEPVVTLEEPVKTEDNPLPIEENQNVQSLDGASLKSGNYIVVGAFRSIENAKTYTKTLTKAGYPAEVAYYPEKKYYIVHMGNVPTLDESKVLRDKYRQMSRYSFRDTWILTID